jgi:hypothetical protein
MKKQYNLRYLLAKVRTTGGKASDRLRRRENATKTVSDVFRHRSETGKSYCRARSDVGSERVNVRHQISLLYTAGKIVVMNILILVKQNILVS